MKEIFSSLISKSIKVSYFGVHLFAGACVFLVFSEKEDLNLALIAFVAFFGALGLLLLIRFSKTISVSIKISPVQKWADFLFARKRALG